MVLSGWAHQACKGKAKVVLLPKLANQIVRMPFGEHERTANDSLNIS